MVQLPPTILVAAFAPALALLALAIRAGGRRHARLATCLGCFAAGALLSAPAAAWINQWIVEELGVSRPMMGNVGAPLVEEILKALVVWLSLRFVTPPREASVQAMMVRGLCVGLGFTATENTQYLLLASLQGGVAGLQQGIFVRGLLWGLHHAIFAAAGAVAIWYARQPKPDVRRAALWATLAIVQHIGWNAVGAEQITTMLCAAPHAGGTCRWPPGSVELFVVTPLLSLGALTPGLAALRLLAQRARQDGSA